MSAEAVAGYAGIDDREYRKRIRAWALYDWANSAFATTILAAVLPVYYSQVAGRTLASPAQATAYWSATLSISLFLVAVLSPILGTISDIKRGKKKFLAFSILIGSAGTALLVFVGTGDWLLASVFFVIARFGFAAGNVFYDALLPHVARPEDQDRVSTFGYALGYLGGGILLAVNIAMIFVLGSDLGTRLSFVSVALWWLVFSIPILRRVPEPPAKVATGAGIVSMTFGRLKETFRHLRQYRELLKFLVAFLIYNDGIGTIIGVAAIYGAELGFGAIELIAAILLVQFVGIPFSVIFGRIPSSDEPRRAVFLAFVLFNLVMLPLVGIGARFLLPADVAGTAPQPYEATAASVGEGDYEAGEGAVVLDGTWEIRPADALAGTTHPYAYTDEVGARYELAFNGGRAVVRYAEGPDRSRWQVLIDGEPVSDGDEPLVVDGYNPTERFDVELEIEAPEPGEHVLTLVNTADRHPASSGTVMAVGPTSVLPPARPSSLPTILALLFVVEVVGLAVAFALGNVLFSRLATTMTTKRTIILALTVYAAIAVWGFFLDTVVEFWFLAFMVAVVQGGSQALSRSLYATLSPTSESGEFFGFFSVMSKFSAIVGPLVFAATVTIFGSSRPAILSIIVFFIVGIVLLNRVDVEHGRQVAIDADVEAAEAGAIERD